MSNVKNTAIKANDDHRSAVENASDYVENFDILETINNVGNDEVFTPRKICSEMLDSLPEEVWHNKDYKWLNPCTKNGVFEREIAIRLDEGLKSVIPNEEERRKHILTKMIFSIGLTKFTSHVARRTLYYCTEANRKCDGIKASDGHYVNGYAIGNGTWFDTEEGNILTPCTDHEFEDSGENAKCKYCGIKRNSSYVDPLQREQYAYEFIHVNHLVLQKHLQKRFFGGNKDMKFDIIIGNPPYQLTDGGGTGSSSKPIYQLFIQQALRLKPKYLCMIIPARWYCGGKGLDDFRDEILNNSHISYLHDYDSFKQVFPSVDLAGGACYFVYDNSYSGDCNVVNHSNGTINSIKRKLNEFPFFIRQNQSIPIVKKVVSCNSNFLEDRVTVRLPFGIKTTYKPLENGVPCWFTQKIGLKFVKSNDVYDSLNIIGKWKLLIPKAPIAGQTDFSKPVGFYYDGNTRIAKPGEVCTESWLVAGSFDTEEETKFFKSYLFTKTVRFLLLQAVVSQNITRKNFCYVPDLLKYDRFYTDELLCSLWNISSDEFQLIRSRIGEIGVNCSDVKEEMN